MKECDEKKHSIPEYVLILNQLLIELNSPVCLNDRRHFIEQELKNISLNVSQILQLLTCSSNLNVHVYLFLLGRLIKCVRKTNVNEQRLLIRDVMLNFALQNHPIFLISYAMRVFVETVKIDWPHDYPTFIDDLRSLLFQKNEVGLILLKEFSEELLTGILASRKKELKEQYFKEFPILLDLVKPFLPNASPIVQRMFAFVPPNLIPLDFLSILLKLGDFNSVNELILRSASPLTDQQLLMLYEFTRQFPQPSNEQYFLSFISDFIGNNFRRLLKLVSIDSIDLYLNALAVADNQESLFDLWERIFDTLKLNENVNCFSFINHLTMKLVACLRQDDRSNASRLFTLLSFVSEIQPSVLIDVAFQLGESDMMAYKRRDLNGSSLFKDLSISLDILSLLNHIVVPEILPWANQLLMLLPELIEYEQISEVNASIINFICAFISDIADSSNTNILIDVCVKGFSAAAQNQKICEVISNLLLRISLVIRPDLKLIERLFLFDLTPYPIALQALSNMFILPQSGTPDESHDWNDRSRTHHEWIVRIFLNPLSKLVSEKNMSCNSEAFINIYRALECILSTQELTTRSRQILCSSMSEIIQISIQEFPSLLSYDTKVVDAMMNYFKTLISVLHNQLGANSCRNFIEIFCEIFGTPDFIKSLQESENTVSILNAWIQILGIIASQKSSSFKLLLPLILDYTFKILYPVVNICPEIAKAFYSLLKEILLNHWKMFYSVNDNDTNDAPPSEKFFSIIKIFAESIITDQSDIARLNVNSLIEIDSKCNMFKRKSFPRTDFIEFLLNRLVCTSSEPIREELILLVYALIKDDLTVFDLCFNSFIQGIHGIDPLVKKNLMCYSFKCISDQPSFIQTLDDFVNDIHVYIDQFS